MRKKVLAYIKSQYQIDPECLWASSPETEVFRHSDTQKWFGIIMPVSNITTGLGTSGYTDLLNVKLDPMMVDLLREQQGFLPAYHMNKTYWLSIQLDGTVPYEHIIDLIDQSFLLTASKKIKKAFLKPEPKDWIIPANPKYYDVISAFEQESIITWKQSSDVHVGDILYMYVGAPYSSIMFKCRALEVDLPYPYSDKYVSMTKAMTIELLEKYEAGVWTFEKIKTYGVYAVRGPRGIPIKLKHDIDSKITKPR